MRRNHPESAAAEEPEGELPAPGTRWGSGAQSVLPYLTKSLQAKPAHAMEQKETKPREGHPVFADWQQRR
jgi:hypothetical protein